MTDSPNAALDLVHAARTPAEVAAGYAAWASDYDRETAALGYCLPFAITSWVARYVPIGQGPLLDAGCGTGLSGAMLAALGYGDVDGLDISPEMLAIARGRGVYRDLKEAALGDPLPWADGNFRAFFSTGVFTIGHAPASGLQDLVRITAKGVTRSSRCATKSSTAAAFARSLQISKVEGDGGPSTKALGFGRMPSPSPTHASRHSCSRSRSSQRKPRLPRPISGSPSRDVFQGLDRALRSEGRLPSGRR